MTDSAQSHDGAEAGSGVLRRLLQAKNAVKAADRGAPDLPQLPRTTPSRAASTAMARAAERLYALPVQTLEATPGAITLAEMAELLPQPALLCVVQGQGEALGVVAIDPAAMTALIEVQTLGRVTARPIESRRTTRSDAMICADFVNAMLDDLGQEMASLDGFEGFEGFRYASYLDDARPLLLMLEDSPYRSLRFNLRFGADGARVGEIFVALPQPRGQLALPEPTEQAAKPAAKAEQPATAPAKPATGPGDLVLAVRDAPIEVAGVLCRRMVRLGDLRGLQPGQLLHLPRLGLGKARLETATGQLLAQGKLGETDGYHAIRLRKAGTKADDQPVERDAPRPETALSRQLPTEVEPPIEDLHSPDSFRDDADSEALEGQVDSLATRKQAL